MKVIPALIACLLLCPFFLDAQQVDDPTLDGLVIYKRHPFQQDRLAQAFEYRTATFYRNVSYVLLASGQRLTLPADADTLWIPYPGRAGYDRETALVAINEAQARYPQYRALLENVRRAWLRTPSVELARQQEKSERRSLATSFTKTISSGLSRLKAVPSMLLSPSLNPTPTPTPEPESVSTADSSSASTNLQKNLEVIRKYYQTTNAETP